MMQADQKQIDAVTAVLFEAEALAHRGRGRSKSDCRVLARLALQAVEAVREQAKMTKCPCAMTALELLQANIAATKPTKSLLIEDRGNGWDVTMYGPESAGRPREVQAPDCITIQATMEQVEAALVNLRRQSDDEGIGGEVLTGEAMVRELSGKR